MSTDKDIWDRIRRAAEAARLSGHSEQSVLSAILAAGNLQQGLEILSDRQVGQLMFDVVWGEFDVVTPAMSISVEGTERLFRSRLRARGRNEVLNDPDKLSDCPICGNPMMHYIGIGEPDYRKCVTVGCGHKIAETIKGGDQR